MVKMSRDGVAATGRFSAPAASQLASLTRAVRRRWRAALVAFGLCVAAGCVYAAVARPVYAATARVIVAPAAPGDLPAEAMRSPAVLARAAGSDDLASARAFAGVAAADRAAALGRALRVGTGEREDFVAVTAEARDPDEAARMANAVVGAYAEVTAETGRAVAARTTESLGAERDTVRQQRDAVLRELAARRNDAAAGGPATGRPAASAAELEARADAARAALVNPARLRAFVQSLPALGDAAALDRDYETLRAELTRHEVMLWAADSLFGVNHPQVLSSRATVDALRRAADTKERAIAEAYLSATSTRLAATRLAGRQSADRARDAALDGLERQAADLQRQLDALDPRVAQARAYASADALTVVRVLEPARPPESPVGPGRPTILLIAAAVGCGLGTLVAAVRERRAAVTGEVIAADDDVSPLPGMPVVGVVPRMSGRLSAAARGQVARLDPRSPAAAAFEAIRAALDRGEARDARTVLVASPTSGDGKSTAAANLAIAYAHAGYRTLLVDGDLRKPVQHLIFGLGAAEASAGLTGVVNGRSLLRDAVRPTAEPGLYLLPCGPAPRRPAAMLANPRFLRLMHTVAGGTFDRVVIDCPPLTSETDARMLAAGSDVTLIVVRAGRSMRELGLMARAALEKVGATVVGAVVNDATGVRSVGGDYVEVRTVPPGTRRLLASIRGGSEDGVGLAVRVRPAARPANEPLDLPEPDWSADVVGV